MKKSLLKNILRILAVLLVLCVSIAISFIFFIRKPYFNGDFQSMSPDKKWMAQIQIEQHKNAPMFVPDNYVVRLKPLTGIFQDLRTTTIFEKEFKGQGDLSPEVTWKNNHNLYIETNATSKDITLQIREYKDIKLHYSEALPEKVSSLQILPLNYGANYFQVRNKGILIIKGRLKTGTAWEQDNYIVMEQQENIWQVVQYEKQKPTDVIVRAVPHTGEDTISTVYFMVPNEAKDITNVSELYLLKVSREYKESTSESGHAKLLLSVLNHDNDDMGVLYFNNIQTISSKAKYCNADSAAFHELQIPLPGDGKDFPCLK